MKEQTFYMLNEEELMKINELCDCLSLAVDKIIRSRRLLREYSPYHPAVKGYEEMIDLELIGGGDSELNDIF